MKRDQDYQIAKDRVKISWITERGIDLSGVIHVGTNDGYEIEWYLLMGLKVLGFEPLPSAFQKCWEKYSQEPDDMLTLVMAGVGLQSGTQTLHETYNPNGQDDSGGSTFLKEIQPQEHIVIRDVEVMMVTASQVFEYPAFKADPESYDCLVVDVQGMELDVLKSFDEAGVLRNFKGLNIECSRIPWYEGEVPAEEVIAFLSNKGFTAISPIEDHNDILFVRNDLL